jgi:hypothetical protein
MSGAIGGLLSSYSIRPTAVLVMNLDATVGAMPGSNITTSASFDGTTQYLSLTSSSAFTQIGDLTVEAWYYPTNVTGSHSLFTLGPDPDNRYVFFLDGTSVASNLYGGGVTTYTTTVPINTWTHIAVVRSGTTVSVYINGTASATTDTQAGTLGNGVLNIGADATGGALFAGYISNFRMTNTAVYTGNFVAPTTTLRAIAGTQLLLPLTATVFTDMSSNMLAITNTGTVITTAQAPTLAAATTDFTGTYAITTTNAGATIVYNSANGGVFRKTTSSGTDSMVLGPNYVTGQSYSVFMAYKISATSPGRLLNTASEAVKDWLLGAYNGNPKAFYPNFSVNLPGSGADTVWHFSWGTFNTGTSLGQLYTATSAQPTSTSFTGTNSGGGGFNQLRLFSRAGGSEVQTADIGMIRVYNGVVTLAQVQSQYAAFKTRFGY